MLVFLGRLVVLLSFSRIYWLYSRIYYCIRGGCFGIVLLHNWSKFARLKAKLTPRAQEIFFQSGKLDLRIYESVDGGIDTPNFFRMSREYHLRYLEQVRALKGPT